MHQVFLWHLVHLCSKGLVCASDGGISRFTSSDPNGVIHLSDEYLAVSNVSTSCCGYDCLNYGIFFVIRYHGHQKCFGHSGSIGCLTTSSCYDFNTFLLSLARDVLIMKSGNSGFQQSSGNGIYSFRSKNCFDFQHVCPL